MHDGHAARIRAPSREHKIKDTIAVDIGGNDVEGVNGRICRRCCVAAISVIEEHLERAGTLIRNHDVELAVTIEIAERKTEWISASEVFTVGRKRAAAVTQKHRNGIGVVIARDEIWLSVVVDVGNRDFKRAGPCHVLSLRSKGAITIAKQY